MTVKQSGYLIKGAEVVCDIEVEYDTYTRHVETHRIIRP